MIRLSELLSVVRLPPNAEACPMVSACTGLQRSLAPLPPQHPPPAFGTGLISSTPGLQRGGVRQDGGPCRVSALEQRGRAPKMKRSHAKP